MSRPLVKVCGVTDASNALACVEAGANYLGLNFFQPSPRSVSIDQAVQVAAPLGSRVELVALFVDHPLAAIAGVLQTLPALRTIQLHGSESVDFLAACRALPARPRIIRAFRLRDTGDVAAMNTYLQEAAEQQASPDAILIDALVAGQAGGTGQAIPLDLLDLLPGHPRLILAGGLRAANVAERVQLVRPWMVDVASGVETRPGWKDPAAVAAFVAAARMGLAATLVVDPCLPSDKDSPLLRS